MTAINFKFTVADLVCSSLLYHTSMLIDVLDCLAAVEFAEELCSMQMSMCTLHINEKEPNSVSLSVVIMVHIWQYKQVYSLLQMNFTSTNFALQHQRIQHFCTSEILIWSINTEDKSRISYNWKHSAADEDNVWFAYEQPTTLWFGKWMNGSIWWVWERERNTYILT